MSLHDRKECMTWYDMAHALPVKGHVAALRFLLDEKLPSEPDVSGRTLMHEARLTLNWWICGLIVLKGVVEYCGFFFDLWMLKLSVKGKSWWSESNLGRVVWLFLFDQAAATGFLPVLDELHSRGFDPKAKDSSGRSVAQDAAEFGHIEVLMLSEK